MMIITPYTSLNLRSTSRSVMRNVKAKLRFRQKIVKSHDAHVCPRNPARSKHITWLAPINPAAQVTRIFISVAFENIVGVDFLLHIVQASVVAVIRFHFTILLMCSYPHDSVSFKYVPGINLGFDIIED